jgi:hypothetical protein
LLNDRNEQHSGRTRASTFELCVASNRARPKSRSVQSVSLDWLPAQCTETEKPSPHDSRERELY